MVSGRQIPYDNARPGERLTRAFNYPPQSNVREASDIERLGIKAFFFSDACAAYRRSFLEQMGGFESPILTNEDMLMAARALAAGYKVGYCADARVYHSHNFSLKQQYRRNFDVAAFLTMYKDEIASGSAAGEGIRMVLYTERQLFRGLHFASMCYCILESAAKFLGNRAGKKYRSMTLEQILKKTSNPAFWRKNGV
jgi:rhamnosyltransferase